MTDPLSLRVAFAGAPGSFAEDAVLAAYPGAQALPVPMFGDVVGAVADGSAAAGVLPIENVVGGGVREVYDLLLDTEAVVVGEVIVPVRLCLAALPGQTIDSIERVYSHIQALTQAEPFLRTRSWTLLAATNTAGAGR
jgi:prephenate dehydratase